MSTQYRCKNLRRRALVDQHATLNGIDYLEVLDHDAPAGGPRQQTLLLRCLKPVTGLDGANVDIAGGVRVTPVGVDWAATATAIPTAIRDTLSNDEKTLFDNLTGGDRVLIVRTDSAGDFSLYTLRLVTSPIDDGAPAGFDPRLVTVDFSFKVECRNDFDCKVETVCPPPAFPAPAIDYMARDYESFRRLMLDRLSVTLADGGWKSRSAADLGVALVESVAYVADHLAYYQDAVAAEAYLDTARTRTSVRRHARLLDYALHDGCNARTWVCIETKTDLLPGAPGVPVIPKGTRLVVGRPGESPLVGENDVPRHGERPADRVRDPARRAQADRPARRDPLLHLVGARMLPAQGRDPGDAQGRGGGSRSPCRRRADPRGGLRPRNQDRSGRRPGQAPRGAPRPRAGSRHRSAHRRGRGRDLLARGRRAAVSALPPRN